MFGGEAVKNLPSNNTQSVGTDEGTPDSATGFSRQPVLEELRSLGLTVALDDAKAMHIKGRLQIIEGRSNQGHYRKPAGYAFGPLIDLDRFYSDCYHAVALEIVDADTTRETLEETIPCFLAEYFRPRKWWFCEIQNVKSYCGGALLEWQGKLLRMTAERKATFPQQESGETDDEVGRRQALLDRYVRRTSASRRSIYEGQSGIHKPQFYEWIKRKLPRDSATCQNFERFLDDGKRPVPRKQKG